MPDTVRIEGVLSESCDFTSQGVPSFQNCDSLSIEAAAPPPPAPDPLVEGTLTQHQQEV